MIRNEKKKDFSYICFCIDALYRADNGFSAFLDGPFFRNDAVGNIQKTHAVAAGTYTVEKLCGYHDAAALCQVDM